MTHGNGILPNLALSPDKATASFMDIRATQGHSTSEMLFMKRLLYLKAMIDQENQQNPSAVPLDADIRAFSPQPGSRKTDGTNRYPSSKEKRMTSRGPHTTEKVRDVTTAEGSETIAITSAIDDGFKTPL
jgi:hypothetical protein